MCLTKYNTFFFILVVTSDKQSNGGEDFSDRRHSQRTGSGLPLQACISMGRHGYSRPADVRFFAQHRRHGLEDQRHDHSPNCMVQRCRPSFVSRQQLRYFELYHDCQVNFLNSH